MGTWFIITATFIAGAALSVFVLTAIVKATNARHRRGIRTGGGTGKPKKRRKIEFSKLVLALVLSTYFVGVFVGVKIALIDMTQLGALLGFIGAPTAAAIGFYTWKAKAENVIKINKGNPQEAERLAADKDNSDTQEGQGYG